MQRRRPSSFHVPICRRVSARNRSGSSVSLLSAAQRLSCGSVTSGWNWTPQHAIAEAKPLQTGCISRKLDRAVGQAVRVVVRLERGEARRQSREDRIGAPGVGELDLVPADLRLGERADPRPRRAREELRAEADPERRHAVARSTARATRSSSFSHACRSSWSGWIAPPKTRTASASGGAPPDAKLHSASRCPAAATTGPKSSVPASPPCTTDKTSMRETLCAARRADPFTSSRRRRSRAFVAACETRRSGLSGSSAVALLLKNA